MVINLKARPTIVDILRENEQSPHAILVVVVVIHFHFLLLLH